MSAESAGPTESAIPAVPVPDGKDWTWVLHSRCADCGFDPAALRTEDLPRLLNDATARWQAVLARPDVRRRPAPEVWSPLEYSAHVRDVYVIFGERATLMIEQDAPTFANWDQDVTALEKRYWDSDPGQLDSEIGSAARNTVAIFTAVTADQWDRVGYRSNGSEFTVRTLGSYFLHDLVHHLHDVQG